MNTPRFKVYWDNGAGACGVFSQTFDTENAAEAYGREWARSMNAEAGIADDAEGYSFEVIEGDREPDEYYDAVQDELDAGLSRGQP